MDQCIEKQNLYHINHSTYKHAMLLLSRFSCVWLCATPEMTAHQAPHPWDSPGKNIGVGCHFLLQCMKVKSEKWKWSCSVVSDPQRPHAALQAPLSMGFSRQEYWRGVPLPFLINMPYPMIYLAFLSIWQSALIFFSRGTFSWIYF